MPRSTAKRMQPQHYIATTRMCTKLYCVSEGVYHGVEACVRVHIVWLELVMDFVCAGYNRCTIGCPMVDGVYLPCVIERKMRRIPHTWLKFKTAPTLSSSSHLPTRSKISSV